MLVSSSMPLGELAEIMGSDVTESQAKKMRSLLCTSFLGQSTESVPQDYWENMLVEAVSEDSNHVLFCENGIKLFSFLKEIVHSDSALDSLSERAARNSDVNELLLKYFSVTNTSIEFKDEVLKTEFYLKYSHLLDK